MKDFKELWNSLTLQKKLITIIATLSSILIISTLI